MNKTVYNLAGYFPEQPKRIIVQSEEDLSGNCWSIVDSAEAVVLAGQLDESVIGKDRMTALPFNYEIGFDEIKTPGNYAFRSDWTASIKIVISNDPVKFLLPAVLDALRMRRSGSHLAKNHAFSHPGDARCPLMRRKGSDNADWVEDSTHASVDMLGGWYDAGDYLKFSLTSAYTVYHLARAYELNPEVFNQITPLEEGGNRLLEELKHGTDFLLKTFPDSETFIIQVGDDQDHREDSRLPENDKLDGHRPALASLSKPQMGATAAALAISSGIFLETGMTDYAKSCLEMAEKVFKAAEKSGESPAWWQAREGFEVYYADRTESDNMGMAAYELYRRTGDAWYLSKAGEYEKQTGAIHQNSWSCYHLELFLATGSETKLHQSMDHFSDFSKQPENLWNTTQMATWGTLYSYFEVASIALQTENANYRRLAWSVYDFTFGINPWGTCFVATEKIPHAITTNYALVYKLQPGIFPEGEIAEGPTRMGTIDRLSRHFHPSHDPDQWHSRFNAENMTFFEHPGNFVTMETTIGGLADGILFLALLSR